MLEMLYEELCLDNYDEEDCTNVVYRFDDADFDYGYDEDSVSMWANLTRFLFASSRKQLFSSFRRIQLVISRLTSWAEDLNTSLNNN